MVRTGQWLHGFLDLCLLSLLHEGPDYGFALAQRLTSAGLGEIPGGTLYPALVRLEQQGLVEVSWATPSADSSFLVAVHVEGLDRAGLLSDVSRVMTEHHSNILSMSANTSKDRVFTMRLQFETPDPTHLASLTNALKRIPGVYEATRIKS